jgi:hypothetical protein
MTGMITFTLKLTEILPEMTTVSFLGERIEIDGGSTSGGGETG